MKLIIAVLLLTACTMPTHYPLRVRQTLLHGSDAAILAGCVRGAIRWEHERSGQYPALDQVALFCEDVRRSFQDEIGEGNGHT